MSVFENKDEIKAEIIENLKNVYDPEIPVNIYDLGLIYEVNLTEKERYLYCKIMMTLTSPACPVAESLIEHVKYHTLRVDSVDEVDVELTFTPPWDRTKISEEGLEIMLASGASI